MKMKTKTKAKARALAEKPDPGSKPRSHYRVPVTADVAPIPDSLIFTDSARKPSPYDVLLITLAQATPGHGLRINQHDVTTTRMTIAVRARKMGIKVSFAEENGVLWVRYDGKLDPRPEQEPKQRRISPLPSCKIVDAHEVNGQDMRIGAGGPGYVSIADRIIEALKKKPMSSLELQEALNLQPNQVYGPCNGLKSRGIIDSREDDFDGTRRYVLRAG